MLNNKVLIIDDDESFLRITATALTREKILFCSVTNGADAYAHLKKERFDVIILDYMLKNESGFDVLAEIQRAQLAEKSEVILVTAHEDDQIGLEAIKKGCYDFISKPFNISNLVFRVRRAMQKISSEERIEILSQSYTVGFENIIGHSSKMKDIFKIIRQVANTDVTVLVEGETGTGKELIARAIHTNSNRKNNLFIPLVCGSLAENLLESELFGHEKGSFTGAQSRKFGILETADKGTVFLDEINSTSLPVQSKLLRFIETKEFMRVGSNSIITCDARIIAATNQDVEAMVKRKEFREDLFHRLNVVRIRLPTLRERKEDIRELTMSFLETYNRKFGHSVEFTKSALEKLEQYDWPGNVRQLKNTIQSLVLLNTLGHIKVEDLPHLLTKEKKQISTVRSFKEQKEEILQEFEVEYLTTLMRETNGNVSKAALLSGLNRKNLIAKLKEQKIDPSNFKGPRK